MTFTKAAEILGISEFPPEMDEIYENMKKSGEYPFTRDTIVYLEEKYGLFQEYFEAVLEGFDDLERDRARKVWALTASVYGLTHTREELKALKLPESDMTPAGQMAPLFPLICRAEKSYFEYLRRGFPEEEARGYLRTYKNSIGTSVVRTGKPGIQKTYFDWSSLYAFCEIFNIGGFNFALGKADETTFVLQNKKTGEIRVLLNGVLFHRSGMPLGAGDFTEEEGSYKVTFEETESDFMGFASTGPLCPCEKKSFSKEEWRLALSPGDDIFVLHIPKGTSLAPEDVAEAFRLAREVAKRSYPEKNIKGVRCTSWLLEPKFESLLGEKSNIARFGALFTRYPFKNNGNGIFSFAFGGKKPQDLRDLPEDTSLQRKVKALYLEGGRIFSYGGFIIDEGAPK